MQTSIALKISRCQVVWRGRIESALKHSKYKVIRKISEAIAQIVQKIQTRKWGFEKESHVLSFLEGVLSGMLKIHWWSLVQHFAMRQPNQVADCERDVLAYELTKRGMWEKRLQTGGIKGPLGAENVHCGMSPQKLTQWLARVDPSV